MDEGHQNQSDMLNEQNNKIVDVTECKEYENDRAQAEDYDLQQLNKDDEDDDHDQDDAYQAQVT